GRVGGGGAGCGGCARERARSPRVRAGLATSAKIGIRGLSLGGRGGGFSKSGSRRVCGRVSRPRLAPGAAARAHGGRGRLKRRWAAATRAAPAPPRPSTGASRPQARTPHLALAPDTTQLLWPVFCTL